MFVKLNEDSRNQLVTRSKQGQREKDGLTRYQKRLKSKIGSNTRQYNRLNMNQLFKQGILTIGIEVRGETDDYIVKIKYGGFLDALHTQLRDGNEIELRNIIKALVIAFNKEDVYIDCSCPDFRYRFGYWATKNNIGSGEPELRPSDETNPNDNLGPGCKHILLVLANTSWIIKVASVIRNYIKYMEQHMKQQYSTIIYPAIYGKKYEEPVQQNMFDTDELDTDTDTIDTSNKEARTRGQFKAGNKYRFTKQENNKDQLSLDDIDSALGLDSEAEETEGEGEEE